MSIYSELLNKETNLAVVGLGYVGMPIAVAFSEYVNVVGFDINKEKLELYRSGIDPTNEIGNDKLAKSSINFTDDPQRLKDCKFIIVAVPTPVNDDHTPNLSPLEKASEIVGKNLSKDAIVVFESTVYPGVTENVCVPILEKKSNLKVVENFKVGYSPERINPGDKVHRLENIRKIVSGIDEDSLREIEKIYNLVIKVGTYPVSNIKTAEAIKVVENSQRDINIAFMNELAIVFDKMGIDSNEVVDGMNTKWNALGFKPGLVGGHCIGVDPYYFTYEAERLGYNSQIILSGRRINNSMGKFIADATIKQLIHAEKVVRKAKVGILGITFKENCPDIRNSKVVDIIYRLREYDIEPIVADPYANKDEVLKEYNVILSSMNDIHNLDCLIIAVAHDVYKKIKFEDLEKYFLDIDNNKKVLIDVKGIVSQNLLKAYGYLYWRL